MMSSGEVAAIDDMRFRERIGSRAEAIRQLIERGLRASNTGAQNNDADGVEPRKLAPVGVVNPANGGPSHDAA